MRRILAAAALLLAACGDNAPSVVFNVTLNPAAATVTAGKTYQLGALAKGKVSWTVDEANGGTVDATGLYTAPATPGTYHVTATSVDDASKSGKATITVVAPAATPAITVNQLVTQGKSASASVPAQDGVTFTWSALNGNLSATTGTSVGATPPDAGQMVLAVTATNAAGDAAPAAVSVSTVVPAAVTPAIQAPFSVTAGRDRLTASVPATPGQTYKWTIGNGAITGSDIGSTITFTAGTPGDLALSVLASNAAGDAAAASSTATVQVHNAGLELIAGAPGGFGNVDDVGADARIGFAFSVAVDSTGNVLFGDYSNYAVRKVAADGTVSTLAGKNGEPGYNDGPGADARFSSPFGIAVDDQDNAYVTEPDSNRIRRITSAGVTSTIAYGGYGSADGGPALGGTLYRSPQYLAVTPDAGEIWFQESGAWLRVLQRDGGVDWVSNKLSLFYDMNGLAIDPDAGLLINRGSSVLAYDAGTPTPIAGVYQQGGFSDGPGPSARFNTLYGLAVAPGGGVAFAADPYNNVLRRLDRDAGSNDWSVSTIAGQAGDGGTEDGPAGAARLAFPAGIALKSSGALVFSEYNTIRQLSGGAITTLAGTAAHDIPADGPGLSARLQSDSEGVSGIALDDDGSAFFTDSITVRRIAPDGTVTTVAGDGFTGRAVDGVAAQAGFGLARGLALDRKNRILYVADTSAHQVRAITWDPELGADVVHGIAGRMNDCSFDDGESFDAGFCSPAGLAVDSTGRLFVSDSDNNAIRMLERTPDAGGYVVSTVAKGAGTRCNAVRPTGRPANTAASGHAFGGLCNPTGMAIDPQDRLYIVDRDNQVIKRLGMDGGVWEMTTLAGTNTGECESQDGESLDAGFCDPWGITVDRDGNLWVADNGNALVRKLTYVPASDTWKVDTVAGLLSKRGLKPGALPARLNSPGGIAATPTGDVMLLDVQENSMLLVRPQ